eukprot:TRINITY_DN3446_c1_g1_i1.p1 TRINITY_DN3446_c1_g1~~TRINITY_DN3446_c1_g1_i1.p1  ORF type:complete len:595 (-),score=168.68 TRINITY_DN3446_c1_g1_i1:37-1821(-)
MGKHGLHAVSDRAWEEHYDLPVVGVRTEARIQDLLKRLTAESDHSRRLQILVQEIRKSPQAFSGDHVIRLSKLFPNNFLLALHLLDHHVIGINCAQVNLLLSLFPQPAQKLDALNILTEHVLDPINRNILFQQFPTPMRRQVQPILDAMRGRSHAYGTIRSERVVFLIDISGSMSTSLRTNCGEFFNRLEFVVHDLHKILHHRVGGDFRFNIITFATHAHKWRNHLQKASRSNLRAAEEYLDHLEPSGGTNTHDALRMAIEYEEADTVYLLSDGEPTSGLTDPRDIINDMRIWLQRRRSPMTINTIAFLMGHHTDDPKPRQLMAQIATAGNGVFRCLDPHTGEEDYYNDGDGNDDDFVSYFEQRIANIPSNLISNYQDEIAQVTALGNLGTLGPVGTLGADIPYNPMGITVSLNDPLATGTSASKYRQAAKRRTRNPAEISIISTRTDLYPERHTEYLIQVEIRGIIPGREIKWTVEHRYNDFSELKSLMDRYLPSGASPKIPGKTLTRNMSSDFVEFRRKQLESYLRQIYVKFDPSEIATFDSFLLYDLYISEAISQAEVGDFEEQNAREQMATRNGAFNPELDPTAPPMYVQ